MTEGDPVLARLMGPGGRFEVHEAQLDGRRVRVFAGAPASLAEFIDRGRANGGATFIVEPGRRLTFDEYFDEVDRLALHLSRRRDCPEGGVVALAARNSAAWMIAFSAIVLSGRIPALINSRGDGASMMAAVADAGACLLIADGKRARQLSDHGCRLPLLGLDHDEDDPKGIMLDDLTDPRGERVPAPPFRDGDVAVLMYTSGTTGRAKAAALSHRSMVLGVMNTQLARRVILERMAMRYNIEADAMISHLPQASSLLIFPLFHTSGCSALFLTSLVNGDKLVLLPRWDVELAFRAVQEERITAMTAVPTMLWDMLNAPTRADFDLSSLRAFSSGGQAISQSLLASLLEAYPEAVFGTGYGMTEVNGSVAQAVGEDFLSRPDAAGRIVPMADVLVVDDEGCAVENGLAGELWVRSASLMNGYWLKGDITEPFKPGGWYATGDIGRVDDSGFVYIIDRKTDMVISGGENIYCAEVELALAGIPGVAEIAAFGVADDRLGERLVVTVASSEPAEMIRQAVQDRAEEALAPYRRPRSVYIRTSPFPRNAMDKVEKHKLREEFLKEFGKVE